MLDVIEDLICTVAADDSLKLLIGGTLRITGSHFFYLLVMIVDISQKYLFLHNNRQFLIAN